MKGINSMDMNKAMELATKCAGQYQEMIRNMYPGLLEEFASVLVKETETAEKTCSSWQDMARQYIIEGELVVKMKEQLRFFEDKADLWDRLIDKGINTLDADTRTKVLRVMERLCVEKDLETPVIRDNNNVRIGPPWSPETLKLFDAVEKIETPTPLTGGPFKIIGCNVTTDYVFNLKAGHKYRLRLGSQESVIIAPLDKAVLSLVDEGVAIEKHRWESTQPSVQNIPNNEALSWLNETPGRQLIVPPDMTTTKESEQNIPKNAALSWLNETTSSGHHNPPRDLLTGASVAFSSGEYVSAGGEVRWDTKSLDTKPPEQPPEESKQETWRDRPSLL